MGKVDSPHATQRVAVLERLSHAIVCVCVARSRPAMRSLPGTRWTRPTTWTRSMP
jgi:hypothetical protein